MRADTVAVITRGCVSCCKDIWNGNGFPLTCPGKVQTVEALTGNNVKVDVRDRLTGRYAVRLDDVAGLTLCPLLE